MAEYTDRYGAITSIINDTTSKTVIDSTGTEFLFEVVPINITEEEINEVFSVNNITNVWFINYTTSVKTPTENDIKRALTDGLIITIYIECQIIDNYGILHIIEYDKIEKKYVIKINQQLKYIILNNIPDLPMAFSNDLIDKCKSNSNVKLFTAITPISRFLFSDLYYEVNKLKEIIKVQEDRIKLLEQK